MIFYHSAYRPQRCHPLQQRIPYRPTEYLPQLSSNILSAEKMKGDISLHHYQGRKCATFSSSSSISPEQRASSSSKSSLRSPTHADPSFTNPISAPRMHYTNDPHLPHAHTISSPSPTDSFPRPAGCFRKPNNHSPGQQNTKHIIFFFIT